MRIACHLHRLLAALLFFSAPLMPGCMAMRFVQPGGGAKGATSPEVEVIRFPTTDGLTLEGRLYPAECDRTRDADSNPPHPRLPEKYSRAIVLHCHGVLDNNTSAMSAPFSDAGLRVFNFDYRGFGHSDKGAFSNRAFRDDALAALNYLRSRPDIDPNLIVVYGHSMGGGYALAVAAAARAEGKPVAAAITACAFSSWRMVANYHVPIAGFFLGGVDGPDPADYVRQLGPTPLLIVHPQKDRDVPVENAYRLFNTAIAANVPASLFIHYEGGHAFPFWGVEPLERTMADFALRSLDQVIAKPPRPSPLSHEGGPTVPD